MSSLRRRASLGLGDQVLFSAQNFLIAFVALRTLGLADLGYFTLLLTLFFLGQAVLRGIYAEPLMIEFSSAPPGRLKAAIGAATGVALGCGLTIAALLTAVAAATDSPGVLLAGGLAVTALLVQDAYRYGLFTRSSMGHAVLNDALVLTVTSVTLVALSAGGRLGMADILMGWAMGSAAGAGLGALQTGSGPRLRRALPWVRSHRAVGGHLAGSALVQQSAGRLSLVLLAILAGPAQLGLITTARTLLTPVNTAITSTTSFALPEAVQRRGASMEALASFTTRLASGLVGTVVLVGALLLFLPEAWGEAMAGPNWGPATSVLVPTLIWVAGTAASQGARIGLRAARRPDLLFRAAAWSGVILLVCTTAGTLLAEGRGAAWGFAVAAMLSQVVWSLTYRRALTEPHRLGLGSDLRS